MHDFPELESETKSSISITIATDQGHTNQEVKIRDHSSFKDQTRLEFTVRHI